MSAIKPDPLRQRLQETFRRAQLLSAEKNFDYAHELFAQCLSKDPNNVAFAEALLANLREKHGNHKRKTSFTLGGSGRALKKALTAQNWPEVLRLGVEHLKGDPWHVPTLRSMAGCCAARHHNEVELVYLKQALNAAPKDADVNRHCARSLGRMGQFDQAIACWHRVEKLLGKDAEAPRMISQLYQEKLKYPHGYPAGTAAASVAASQAPKVDSNAYTSATSPPSASLVRDLPNEMASSDSDTADAAATEASLTVNTELPSPTSSLPLTAPARPWLRRNRLAGKQTRRRRPLPPIRLSQLPWLEIALVAAFIGLLFQLFPATAKVTLLALDVRYWAPSTWLLLFVTALCSFGTVYFREEIFG